jgi:hypothetical protein
MRFEDKVIDGGPIALPGAKELLSQIDAGSSPSARGWTIVTSGMSPIPFSSFTIWRANSPNSARNSLPHLQPKKNDEMPHPATNVYTPKALLRTGIPQPSAGYVTGNDVKHGKPQPDPYLAGAERVAVDPKDCKSFGRVSGPRG